MDNSNTLKKVRDEAVIMSLLSTTKETNAEVFVWRLVGDSKKLSNVRIESIRKARNDFCIVPILGYEKQVQDLIGSQGYIDLFVPSSALLLRCAIKQTEAPTRYYLQVPEFVAQVERRKSFRLNVYDSSEMQLSFGKSISMPRHMSQNFKKTCFDISSGGFSFLVSRMESKFFNIHDPIRTIELTAGDFVTRVNAEIALIKEVEPDEHNHLTYKVWRVCCRFTMIDDFSKKYLERYIFERLNEELHVINE